MFLFFLCVLQEASHSQQEQLEQIPELKGCGSFLVSIKKEHSFPPDEQKL